MLDPSDLATPLDAPPPRGLLLARLSARDLAAEGEQPPQRYPAADVRKALRTPPPVRFRQLTPMDEPMSAALDPVVSHEVTDETVRQAFTFGADEPTFNVMGVEDYGWAPRRKDQGLFYGKETLDPPEQRQRSPMPRTGVIIWGAAAVGLLGGMVLAAWSAA